MSDLRSKVQRRVKDTAEKSPSDILKAEGTGMRRTTVYLPADSVRALKRIAADEDTTMSALINEGVEVVLRRGQ